MLKEFKNFALRGNALDMAVGIIIGASFSTIVNSSRRTTFSCHPKGGMRISVNEGVNNGTERCADDNTDCHVECVSAQRKILEFLSTCFFLC